MADDRVVFPGLARPEADRLAALLAAGETETPDELAVAVELPVMLSDDAGPHLLCADGSLALALGEHPHLAGLRVAMAEPKPDHRIGVVGPLGGGLWRWRAQARVSPARRVEALDALAAAADRDDLTRWGSAFGDGG